MPTWSGSRPAPRWRWRAGRGDGPPVRVLVTGADGFVGRYLVRHLLQAGDQVAAGCRPGGPAVSWARDAPAGAWVEPLPLEITDDGSIAAALAWEPEAIVHLAAIASVREAREDPGTAWEVNAAGTARLAAGAAALREAGRVDPVFLLVSTGEVYGPGGAAPPASAVARDPTWAQPTTASSAAVVAAAYVFGPCSPRMVTLATGA